jgi:hypothetical protein
MKSNVNSNKRIKFLHEGISAISLQTHPITFPAPLYTDMYLKFSMGIKSFNLGALLPTETPETQKTQFAM